VFASAAPAAPLSRASGLEAALRRLRCAGGAHAGAVLGALEGVKAAAAAPDAGATAQEALEACRLVALFLDHEAEEVCICACSVLPSLQALLLPGSAGLAEDAGSASAARDVHVGLLAQLGVSSGSLRCGALEALERLPHWDPEVFVRSVRIPPFKKVSEAEAAGERSGDAPQEERWHGALYFALDDELPGVRAATLSALRSAVHRQDLRYCRLLEGIFQRVAAVSTLCLIDDDAEVRRTAADTLVSAMQARGVSLISPTKGSKSSPDTVHVSNVLQALPVDPAMVLKVLRGARFADVQSLEAAVTALVELDDRPVPVGNAAEEQLRATLAHLGQAHASMIEPAGGRGCINIIPGAGRCRGLGHRLYAQMVEACERSGVPPTGESKDMGVGALHVSSPRLERLRALLLSAVASRPTLRTCVPGLDAPPASSACGAQGAEESLACWARHLWTCYERLRRAALPKHERDGRETAALPTHGRDGREAAPPAILPGRGARRGLHHLRRVCLAAAREARPGPASLAGNLSALAAWSALFVDVSEALVDVETSTSERAAAARAAQIHAATSWLMHGFEWGAVPGGFPQVLLAFRLLSLRLLAFGPALEGSLRAACAELGASTDEASEACKRPLRSFLPRLPEGYFAEMLGPGSRVVEHTGRISRVMDGGKPCSRVPQGVLLPLRLTTALGGLLSAEVESSLPRGAFLRASYPRAGRQGSAELSDGAAVPSAGGDSRACSVPLDFPWEVGEANVVLRLQLVLRVDSCSVDDSGAVQLQRGATGLDEHNLLYQRLNELPLGPSEEVPFTVVPTPVVRDAPGSSR